MVTAAEVVEVVEVAEAEGELPNAVASGTNVEGASCGCRAALSVPKAALPSHRHIR
jgi:hypothetical protein